MAVPAVNASTSRWAVNDAIRTAAQATGASFSYLLATAKVESNLDPGAASSSSSARGLFQFIDQTWLGMIKEAGPALGLGRYAQAIERNAAGRFEITDPALARDIMDLRRDPTANAAMAGAFTQRNAARLTARLGREPSEGELYVAHFLGPAGAAKLITRAANEPRASAAEMFPAAAAANRSIFYDRIGNARSVAEVRDVLVGRHARAREGTETSARVIAAATPPAATPAAGRFEASQFAAATYQPEAVRAAGAPVFHGLFQSEGERAPVSRFITDLWTSRPHVAAALSGVDQAMKTAAVVDPPRARDMFGAQGTDAAALFGRRG